MRPPRGTVLAIEDDPVICSVLSDLLTRHGLAVETTADGASGLARMTAGDVDLVILDVVLPDLDGLELCRQFRARGGDVYVPIIMLTALGAEPQRRAGFAAGADDYIVKPFEPGDLLDRVHAWLETRARLKDAHDRLVRLQRQLWESERQRAEAATLQLAAIVESSDDAIISHTLDGIIVSWNPGAERLYGYSALEAIGQPLTMLIPPTRGSELPGILASLQRGERVEPYETVRVRQDGSTIDVSMSISPMRDPSGVIATAASIARDITERRSAERLKDEFVSMVTHEIRTPLNSVIGMTGLLLDTSLDPPQREYAAIVRRSGLGLLAVINDILDYSKIEAGKLDLEVVDVDVREVVEDVAELLASEAQHKNVELVTVVQPDLPRALRGDPGRLRQILTNLVGNATKFTEQGEVVVRARRVGESAIAAATPPPEALQADSAPASPTTTVSPDAAIVWFEVSDTGIGISDRGQKRLFRPFQQADSETTRKYGGTGLGLAICKRLVDLMDGEIGVESERGQGSKFWFTARLHEQSVHAASSAASGAEYGALRGRRVLVADDHTATREALREQLAYWGMAIETADSTPRALDLIWAASLQERTFDVALVDVDLPGGDVLDLARTIAASAATASKRLILLTPLARRQPHDPVTPIAGSLTKPLRQSQLRATLAAALGETDETTLQVSVSESPAAPRPMVAAPLLVAEDLPLNQRVTMGMLEKLGYRADAVANGLEVLEALERIPYAAVLMDCQMPEMDGLAASAEIRRREGAARHTPIIALTASALQSDRDRCFAAGMDDYVTKPVHVEDLERILARWVPPGPAASPRPRRRDSNGPPAPQAAPPIIDPAALAQLRQLQRPGQPNKLNEFISLFLQEAPRQLAALRGAIDLQAPEALHKVAHGLKSQASLLGAHELMTLCAQMEELGRSGSLEGALELVAAADATFERARAALTAIPEDRGL